MVVLSANHLLLYISVDRPFDRRDRLHYITDNLQILSQFDFYLVVEILFRIVLSFERSNVSEADDMLIPKFVNFSLHMRIREIIHLWEKTMPLVLH